MDLRDQTSCSRAPHITNGRSGQNLKTFFIDSYLNFLIKGLFVASIFHLRDDETVALNTN